MKIFSAPINVDFYISAICNLKCKHCFAYQKISYQPTLEQIKQIINFLAEAKVFNVILTGGEPLIRDDFFEILEYLKKLPIRVGLNTNATLINKTIAKKISKGYFKNRILASLDGATQKTYEALRGNGTFKLAIKGIESLLNYNSNVKLFCVVNKYNFTELAEIVKLAKKLGAKSIEFNCLSITDSIFIDQIRLNSSEKKEAIAKILELKQIYGDYIKGSFVRFAEKINQISLIPKKKLLKLKPQYLQNCPAGFSSAAIRADGKISPCYAILDYTVGDIFKESLYKIWQNSTKLQEFRKTHKISLNKITACKDCIYKGVCNGGCRASAYYYSKKTNLKTFDSESCIRLVLDGNK